MTLLSLKNNFARTLGSIYPKEEIDSFFYLLMGFKLQLKRVDFALNPNQKISDSDATFFTNALKKLQKEIPIQYIIGTTEFYGLPFYVNEHVLIPRPETEELVSWILDGTKPKTILDIGTGSGCVAISLAKNLKNTEVWALEISKDALKIAQKNAKLNNVDVNFLNKDILTLKTLPQQFDIIVSNPPYVRMQEKQEIKNNVLDNEPHLALFVDDNNPLLFYDKIADIAIKNLTKNGVLFFEINQYLGEETVALLKNKGFMTIELRKDIFGNDRMIKIYFEVSI
ncbi:MAG: peptide chain release factor N(5)-glutamine methyltransferase [Flavobacteriaceae bacterium]|nr:peptide chain release factor N(5)-glutamine methyltransferase [Flavobacteriaceae bacterium]